MVLECDDTSYLCYIYLLLAISWASLASVAGSDLPELGSVEFFWSSSIDSIKSFASAGRFILLGWYRSWDLWRFFLRCNWLFYFAVIGFYRIIIINIYLCFISHVFSFIMLLLLRPLKWLMGSFAWKELAVQHHNEIIDYKPLGICGRFLFQTWCSLKELVIFYWSAII